MDATYVKFGDEGQKGGKAQSISFRLDFDAECGRMSHVDIICSHYQDVLDHIQVHLKAFKMAAERNHEYHTVQFHFLPIFKKFTDRIVTDCKENFNISLHLFLPGGRLLVIDVTNDMKRC